MLKRRLYLQIYATIVTSIVAVVVLSGLLWNLGGRDQVNREIFAVASRLAHAAIPPGNAPSHVQKEALADLGRGLDTDISLFDAEHRLIVAVGKPAVLPARAFDRSGWRGGRGGPYLILALPDGRSLVVNTGRRGAFHPLVNLAMFLGSVAIVVGLVAYPLVRRLTRRLERLKEGVDRIGRGELATRVRVEGRDEIASLARSFNEAAEKIERLLDSHRMLLASASHELRTPLARIRLGVEMLKEKEDPARRQALHRDIAELDLLIDEIMLMSRLDAGTPVAATEPVDLVALAAEECAHFEHCTLSGSAPPIEGEPNLLRRLVRNLLKNAVEHGAPPIEVELRRAGEVVVLGVGDCGAGIPEDLREKVFLPFYRGSDRQNVTGYGLGLALVRQIAEAHGGEVAVVRGGRYRSTIEVRLPVAPRTAPKAAISRGTALPANGA